MLATDWFYKNEHDLVVDTASMLGGLQRINGGARFRKDQGPKVNHFRYFTNGQSINWLRAALTRGDQDSGGFLPIESPEKRRSTLGRGIFIRRRADSAPRPIAVVLPGTMGSELNAGDDRVWLNYGALFTGGLGKLRMGKPDITPVGLPIRKRGVVIGNFADAFGRCRPRHALGHQLFRSGYSVHLLWRG